MVIAFLGAGKMCEAMVKGIVESEVLPASSIYAYDIKFERLLELEKIYGINPAKDPNEAVKACDILILAVKPQDAKAVMSDISSGLTSDKILLSIVAGLSIKTMNKALGESKRVVRVMPNNPALLSSGISAISFGDGIDEVSQGLVLKIIGGIGETVVVDEGLMNHITAISGSGPAYFYLFAELLIKAAQDMGLEISLAKKLVIETMYGSARMAKFSGKELTDLIEMVASPKGTTEAALSSFEKNDLYGSIKEAAKAAFLRGEELGRLQESD